MLEELSMGREKLKLSRFTSLTLLETECHISSQDSNVLLLDVEMLGCQGGSYRQTFRLKRTTEVKLVGKFNDANYPYQIKCRMERIHYKLKVKLSLQLDQT